MRVDRDGLCAEDACIVEGAVAACFASTACVAAATAASAAIYGMCVSTLEAVNDWINDHPWIYSSPDDDESGHRTGARESTREKHEAGDARRKQDKGGEKGDSSRNPYGKRPSGWSGPWPPKR